MSTASKVALVVSLSPLQDPSVHRMPQGPEWPNRALLTLATTMAAGGAGEEERRWPRGLSNEIKFRVLHFTPS